MCVCDCFNGCGHGMRVFSGGSRRDVASLRASGAFRLGLLVCASFLRFVTRFPAAPWERVATTLAQTAADVC